MNIGVIRSLRHVIQRNVVMIRQCDQMDQRNGLKTALIARVHRLPDSKKLSNFFLSEIMILPHILNTPKVHNLTSMSLIY